MERTSTGMGGMGSDPREIARPELARMLDVIRPKPQRRRMLLRLGVFALVVACTVFAWLFLQQLEQQRVQGAMEGLARTLEQRWSETSLQFLQPARTICDEIDSGAISDRSQFTEKALSYRKTHEEHEGFFWLAQDLTVLAGVSVEGDAADILPFNAESVWQQLRRKSGGTKPVVGPTYESGYGRALVMLFFPLGEAGDHTSVVVILRTSRLMERFVDDEVRALMALSVVRDDQVIYRTGEYLVEPDARLRQVTHLPVLDQQWVCQMMPRSQFIRQYRSSRPELALAVGLLGCVASAGWLFEMVRRRWQHTILEQGHLQVIDIMSELTQSVSASRGDWDRSLQVVLGSARLITNCDVVAIYRIAADSKRLEMVSAYGDLELNRTIELQQRAEDLLADLLAGGMVEIGQERSDAQAELRLFSDEGLHSAMLSLLQGERVMGLMIFGSRQKEPWSAGRQSLVKLWASQTAALLGDEAIHEQMRDALGVQEKLALRREMMLTLLGEIYQAGSIEGTLSHIAQHSPKSLGIEACVVMLRTKQENELEIVAATGDLGVRFFGLRLSLTGEQVVRLSKSDSVTVFEPHEVATAGFGKLAEPWLAGIAYIPMTHSDGRPIGCLLLLSASQVGFTSDQLDLARVLASRASAAIENARLNQQIRRDAETRAMLLRELNHRVKNNLAGIVGLLSMSSNMEMPPNVRQWLDRVIERIGNIARAHELFSGGITAVSLSQLVEQVIPSLAVVKPPGVVIVKELGDRETWLKTSQAVSLAMIIHELCYNAIVHGLGARGTLTIRATQIEGKSVALDIIDDGTAGTVMMDEDGGIATMAPPTMSTGLGLRLVKGLVGRELRGRFLMRQRSEGGTIVTVEFPQEREEKESSV